jgi:hypothetical protein
MERELLVIEDRIPTSLMMCSTGVMVLMMVLLHGERVEKKPKKSKSSVYNANLTKKYAVLSVLFF